MARITQVAGPRAIRVGETVSYRAAAFDPPNPTAADLARIRWLVKSADGGVLGHLSGRGAELRLIVPETWSGLVATVMPYVNSPTANVSVTTVISPVAALQSPAPRVRQMEIARDGTRYYASADGEPRFYLGTDVRYGSRRGLMNSSNPPGPRYRPEDFEGAHGDWAWYLYPTITCESRGHFSCLNTYDTAAFTFGHLQLGAHTPGDNFVLFFRQALQTGPAAEYFPDLRVVCDVIHAVKNGVSRPLESSTTTAGLMRYFNSSADRVDSLEAERAALIVDWSLRHPAMRELQVAFAVREQQAKLRRHARSLPLDGVTDKLCIVVLDVLHQGRAKYPAIGAALQAGDPFDALLGLGSARYRERVATLRSGIRELEIAGRIGRKVFDSGSGSFVEPRGA